MSLFNQRPCPQCGATQHRNVSHRRGWHECMNCGLHFSTDTQESTQYLQTERNHVPIHGDPFHTSDWRRWLLRWPLMAAAALIVLGLGYWVSLQLGSHGNGTDSKHTSIIGTSLHENGGRLSFIRVFEIQSPRGPALQIVVDDLRTGERLSTAHPYLLAQEEPANWAHFRTDANGSMALLLQKKMLLEFHPDTQQFVDVTPELAQTMMERFGVGIDRLEFQGTEWPGAILLHASNGKDYYVLWPARIFLPQAQAASAYAAAQAQYTQVWQSYGLAPSVNGEPGTAYIVRYLNKGGPDQMVHRPTVPLYRMQADNMARQLAAYQPVGDGFALRIQDAKLPGLLRVDPLVPMHPRRNAEVLATNAKAVLIAFDPPGEERLLQLLDRKDHRVLWSQPQSRIPELASRTGDIQLQATPVTSGFYLRNGFVTPVLLIGNTGQVLFDFSRRDGGNADAVTTPPPVNSAEPLLDPNSNGFMETSVRASPSP